MKSQFALSFVLSALVFPALAHNQFSPDSSDSLYFVKIAAQVAENVQHESLDNYTGVYISEQDWTACLKDGDLSPFLKVQEAKANRSAACVFSSRKDTATCVYFDDKSPFGEVSAKTGAQGGLAAVDLAAAYKPISKDMLKKSSHKWRFTETNINTDAGMPLPGFAIQK